MGHLVSAFQWSDKEAQLRGEEKEEEREREVEMYSNCNINRCLGWPADSYGSVHLCGIG